MTLTTPGCPGCTNSFPGMVEVIYQARSGHQIMPQVNLVWDPPWTQDQLQRGSALTTRP